MSQFKYFYRVSSTDFAILRNIASIDVNFKLQQLALEKEPREIFTNYLNGLKKNKIVIKI